MRKLAVKFVIRFVLFHREKENSRDQGKQIVGQKDKLNITK